MVLHHPSDYDVSEAKLGYADPASDLRVSTFEFVLKPMAWRRAL
jgi:hypothetical protein